MSVIKEKWGYHNGYQIDLITIENENGMKAKFTNYGAAVVGIEVPDINGNPVDVVLGYDDFIGYLNGKSFQGATAGRYANRIGGASFVLNGETYKVDASEGGNLLHGGFYGYDKRIWMTELSQKQNSVIFTYYSHDGEGGFPGNLEVNVKFSLLTNNELKIEYFGKSDEDTLFNLTNHSYFNLNGKGNILNTKLQINSINYTPVDEFLIPTGEIAPVFKTPFNFTKPKLIGSSIENAEISGYDHNFLIGDAGQMKKAATAYSSESGIIMAVFTDMPAIQLYTSNGLNEVGKNKEPMGKYSGFCLETQFTPNTPNMDSFPSCVIKKGKLFKSVTCYAFGIKSE